MLNPQAKMAFTREIRLSRPEEQKKTAKMVLSFLSFDCFAINAPFLFCSSLAGGHRASAEALATQFQRHFPGASYDLLDVSIFIFFIFPPFFTPLCLFHAFLRCGPRLSPAGLTTPSQTHTSRFLRHHGSGKRFIMYQITCYMRSLWMHIRIT